VLIEVEPARNVESQRREI